MSDSALYEWVKKGVLTPKYDGVSRKHFFSQDDLKFGRALRALVHQYRGQYGLTELAEIVRGERDLKEYNNSPPGAPRPHQETYEAEVNAKGESDGR